MSTTPIRTKIHDAAQRNASLLQGLHETDSAPSQLEQQNAYIADLDRQIASTTKRVKDLKGKTALELKDHEKYRDSTMRRFAHKATGRKEKFAEKAAKEEKEYFDAMQAQKSAEDELSYLQHLLSEAHTARTDFQASTDLHKELQSQLDKLYNSIFAGHTPGFPTEDMAESAVTNSQQHLSTLTQSLEREKHVLFILGQMSQKLSDARNQLSGAYDMSQFDMFGGGTMSSMRKRNYLELAESCVQQVRMLQDQIAHMNVGVPSLGDLNIHLGSIWSDVVFDNIFTDMDMHDKIKGSMAQVERAGNQCGQIIREREGRLRGVQGEVKAAEGQLKEARAELQKVREEAFAKVLGGERVDAPAYSEESQGGGERSWQAPEGPPPGYSA
jgi:DNA repair exonuclease SbcCD ATPase subunit